MAGIRAGVWAMCSRSRGTTSVTPSVRHEPTQRGDLSQAVLWAEAENPIDVPHHVALAHRPPNELRRKVEPRHAQKVDQRIPSRTRFPAFNSRHDRLRRSSATRKGALTQPSLCSGRPKEPRNNRLTTHTRMIAF